LRGSAAGFCCWAFVLFVLIALTGQGWFRVQQNEVAYVTRFGQVVNPDTDPLGPGLHFKLPLIDEADMVSISTDTVAMPAMKVFTRDTQEVSLQLSLTYNVPPSAAYRLLHEIGRSGNIDISHNLEAVSNDVCAPSSADVTSPISLAKAARRSWMRSKRRLAQN
jgi:regulator of protease activity HflC (stomatin/prohibitin superfamily)